MAGLRQSWRAVSGAISKTGLHNALVTGRREAAGSSVAGWAGLLAASKRQLATDASSGTSQEQHIARLLKEALQPTKLKVEDVSGGCGAMYSVEVESPLFAGKPLVAQHRMVNQILAKEIAEMHGMSLVTRPSKPAAP